MNSPRTLWMPRQDRSLALAYEPGKRVARLYSCLECVMRDFWLRVRPSLLNMCAAAASAAEASPAISEPAGNDAFAVKVQNAHAFFIWSWALLIGAFKPCCCQPLAIKSLHQTGTMEHLNEGEASAPRLRESM